MKRQLDNVIPYKTDKKRALSQPDTLIRVVSASYGPSEGRRLVTGELSNDEAARIPYTRDVTPFLRALLVLRKHWEGDETSQLDKSEHKERDSACNDYTDEPDLVRLTGGMARNFIPIMDGQSMNAIFGDPCPGISKRLHVHYVIYDSDSTYGDPSRVAASEVHRVSFAEHERVTLRRRTTIYQDDSKLRDAVVATSQKLEENKVSPHSEQVDDVDVSTLRQARQLGRSQTIADIAAAFRISNLTLAPILNPQGDNSKQIPTIKGDSYEHVTKWRLRSATSEIVLPILLPFLEVRERVLCQMVGKVWRLVVKNWGVAQTVDVNDEAFPNFTPQFLRGILAHSHHSLQSLLLNDFQDLRQEDLHPALPHLRKLRSLDISRCNQLDDSTMYLISTHLQNTLEVLYLKGLRKVTDNGLISICKSCRNLKVLEISNIPITDVGAICIGDHLTKLSALHARDNYLLTNKSIDVITEKCTQLTQLTLWGCIRLSHLSFERDSHHICCGNLVLLNLWGCHSLLDDAAKSLGSMQHLRSLIVSECHLLTNTFLLTLAEKTPALNHLSVRYCKRITDDGIHAIANSMHNLYTLDLSFCTRITSASLVYLLEQRYELLLELRLQNCTQLEVVREARPGEEFDSSGLSGSEILKIVRFLGERLALSMIDLRNCGGQGGMHKAYPIEAPFVRGMEDQRFKQKVPGLFLRPAILNATVQLRLGLGLGMNHDSIET